MENLILIPDALRDHSLAAAHFADLAVYLNLCLLDDEIGDGTFVLPPRSDMAARCRCSHQVLTAAYRCLANLDLLKISRPANRRGVRSTVQLYRLRPTVTATVAISQGFSLPARSYPPKLKELHAGATITDRRSNSLSDFSLDYLSQVSGGPTPEDLATAIREVETFTRPTGGFIYSIVSVFLSRFQKDAAGSFTGRLDPMRKNQLHTTNATPTQRRSAGRRIPTANIHPTEEYSPGGIDRICWLLHSGSEDLHAGDVPLYLLDLPYIVRSTDDRLSLDPRSTLYQVAEGYWLASWREKATHA